MDKLIKTFYSAFQENDAEAMARCYHEDVNFEDPEFGSLKGVHAGNMWRMLCSINGERTILVKDVEINGDHGCVNWDAHYIFSRTGKKVYNQIHAEFEFREGLIVNHIDTFNLHEWAKQALGLNGRLIGGTRFFKKKLNKQAQQDLKRYEKKNVR